MFELLEMLMRICRCQYISDLPYTHGDGPVADAIGNIGDEMYALSEWNTALSYVWRRPVEASTVKEAKRLMIERMML